MIDYNYYIIKFKNVCNRLKAMLPKIHSNFVLKNIRLNRFLNRRVKIQSLSC